MFFRIFVIMSIALYIAIGFVLACLLVWLIIMSFGYGLAGKSPLLLRPIQIILVGSLFEKLRMLFWVALIFIAGYFAYHHLHISIH